MILFCFVLFHLFIPFIVFALLFSLSLLVVSQIRGPMAGSSPPSPLRFVPCIFIARRFQLFLLSSTCVELCSRTPGARPAIAVERVSQRLSTGLERLEWNETARGRSFHSKLFVSILNFSRQPSNRPEQKITQLTVAAGPRSSTRRQGCRHVGGECS